MTHHEVLIKRIFQTFFIGVEYEIEVEKSLNYLYNIKLTNLIKAEYPQHCFVPHFKFNGTENVYSEDDFTSIFRNFTPNLSGGILIYTYLNGRNRIIVTPEQIKNENYGIIARIKDPHKNKFDNFITDLDF